MPQLRFEGCSDDTFGEVAHFRDDFDNCASGEPVEYLVTAPDGDSLLVVGQYCPGGATGWLIGVAHADDDDEKPLPAWPMRVDRGDRPYSPALIIEAPEGVTLKCLQRTDDA
ncbi:MAG: hypothetical protein ACM3SS_06915 [Rhodospirillaceae bacterium]